MTAYAKIKDGKIVEFPVQESTIRKEFPNVSFSSTKFIPPEGYVVVENTTQMPMLSAGQSVKLSDPISYTAVEKQKKYIDGKVVDVDATVTKWKTEWITIEPTAEVLQIMANAKQAQARAQRDNLLVKCDWTQTNDSPLSAQKKTEWALYRQALRDVPAQSGFPLNIVWPTKPQ